MKYGLRDETIDNINRVFEKYPKIQKVIIYGSRAKGNYKNGSDIDLTLIGEDINIQDLNLIYIDLDELYLPYMFDISIYKNLENLDLIDHINRVGCDFYIKNERI